MRDIYKLCDVMKMLAQQCDTCGCGKITLFADELAKIQRDAIEIIETQQGEIEKSNEKIMYLLDELIKGRE